MIWEYTFVKADIQQPDCHHYSSAGWIRGNFLDDGDTAKERIMKLGKEGWELVAVTPISTEDDSAGMTKELLFTFKKPIE